ncbi:MAG TPA: helix-turn-helix transcriptional regulator [Terracidiphilus sp.]|nr:helix-turn-helix transcriptional regulator [Terracidiphilus sp.]
MQPARSQITVRARFAVNLRLARLSCGFSQEELAARAGLHRNYIGSVERNEKNISIDSMERLAAALGVDVVDLLKRVQA